MLAAGLALAAAYLAVAAYFYVEQRSMLFVSDRTDVAPAAAGLPGAEVHRLTTADGIALVAWSVPGSGPDTVLYLHGNGGSLADRVPRIRTLAGLGFSVLAIDYRGYGGSGGRPSEAGLARDADAAYAFLRRRGVETDHLLVYGESLGTGVAVSLAARRPVAGLILDAAFSSVVDVAADRYWMLPVRWLLADPFRSDRAIGHVAAPILMLHGDRDGIVPIRYGRRLLSFAPAGTRFEVLDGAGHTVLQDPRAQAAVRDWLASRGGPGG